jgi:hypothetical protein
MLRAAPHTGFEYVRDHLGYRLELLWAEFADTIKPGGAPLTFRAGLVNWCDRRTKSSLARIIGS